MNVVFISNQSYPFGMAGSKRVRLFAEYLAKQKISTNVFIYTKSNGNNKPRGSYNKVKYQFIKYRLKHIFWGSKSLIKHISHLYSKKEDNYVIVYGGLNIESYRSIIKLQNLGYKLVVDLVEDYSLIEEQISKKLALRFVLNSILNERIQNKIDGFVVISTFLKQKLAENNVDPNYIKLIPISAENINYRYNKSSKRESYRYLYSGTYGIKDGIEFLLEAYNRLYEKYNNVELYLTGKTGKNRRNYKYLDELNTKNNINFIGRISDEKYYDTICDTDSLLMTRIDSDYANSGFPFKLGEYLATGRPVIGTNVGDVTTYLKDKYDIILANPSDVDSIYSSMEYAYLNRKDCLEIGLNGRNTANKHFNPEVNGKLLLDFLKRL